MSVRLCYVYLVVDACSTIEIEELILKHQLLLVGILVVGKYQEWVVGTLHGVHPEVVAHFKMFAYLLACESHHVELVLIFIKVEHVANI